MIPKLEVMVIQKMNSVYTTLWLVSRIIGTHYLK